MHYGCYANYGYTPCGYTAYERSFMGWYTISTPKANTTYTIDPLTPELKGKSYRIQSDYNANEYYILENRAKIGWDAYLPASGLQVTHVYYNATRWDRNTVNNYNNVAEVSHPQTRKITEQACQAAGVQPNFKSVRAGTTAAMFVTKGLVGAYTIFTGQNNEHNYTEWLSEDDMFKSYVVALNIVNLVAQLEETN